MMEILYNNVTIDNKKEIKFALHERKIFEQNTMFKLLYKIYWNHILLIKYRYVFVFLHKHILHCLGETSSQI